MAAGAKRALLASAVLNLNRGGTLEISLSSAEAVQAALPKSGMVEAKWKGVDHGLCFPSFPKGWFSREQSSGQVRAQWFPGWQVEVAGGVKTSRTQVVWQGGKKPFRRERSKEGIWISPGAGEALQGDVSLALGDHGLLKGDFQLPLAAGLSPVFDSEGPLKFALQGELKDQGFLAALYPEIIKRSRGRVGMNFSAEGTWNQPRFKGALQIAETAIQFSPGEKRSSRQRVSGSFQVEVSSGAAAMEWGERGLRSSASLEFKNHGKLEGKIISSDPARFAFPREGKMEMTWTALNLSLLQPLWPRQISAEGMASAQITANWRPDFRLEALGDLKIPRGKLSWKGEGGLISAGLNQGKFGFFMGGGVPSG